MHRRAVSRFRFHRDVAAMVPDDAVRRRQPKTATQLLRAEVTGRRALLACARLAPDHRLVAWVAATRGSTGDGLPGCSPPHNRLPIGCGTLDGFALILECPR